MPEETNPEVPAEVQKDGPPPEARMGYDYPMTDAEDGPDMDEFFASFGLMESTARMCESMSRVAAEAAADACMDTAMSAEDKSARCMEAYRGMVDNMGAAWALCVNSMPPSMHAAANRSGKKESGLEERTCKREMRSEGDGRKIIGYPIVFNELSQDLGGFRERILPDAVRFTDDVRADFNHSPDFILGRRNAGTLDLSIDATGVRMDVTAPETTWATDLLASMKRGDIDQGSFAFRVAPNGQTWTKEGGENIRTLTSIIVSRVSVVSDPAYVQTSMQVRSSIAKRAATPAPDVPKESDAAGLAAPPATDLLMRELELSLSGV